jgi:RNA polymerase sigma factor (TIGR02999 family)
LLRAWADGDEQALEQLVSRVYLELLRLAGHMLRNQPAGQSMQASDLVHEVYLKLVDAGNLDWKHRAHFFGVAATLMRRILIDRARRRMAAKRGGKLAPIQLSEGLDLSADRSRQLIALDDALDTLADRPAKGARRRTAVLRRPERERNGDGSVGVARDGHAGLDGRSRVAAAGDAAVGRGWSLLAGLLPDGETRL